MRQDIINFIKDYRVIILIVFLVVSVASISISGITEGLDLKGGSSIQIELQQPVNITTMDTVVNVLNKRLDVFGVKDVQVRPSGNQSVIVEVAGVQPQDVANLVGTPGKFDATIGNQTVLLGSDIVTVQAYTVEGNTWSVPFTITTAAADSFAQAANGKSGQPVNMYLDNNLVSSPQLDPGLANGVPSTDVEVSGTAASAAAAQTQAKNIQTILQSGSLPVQVSIEGVSSVSAQLGNEFANGALIAGLAALIVISAVILFRYRTPILVIPIIFTSLSELVLILGVASIIHWNIDLSAIAGIIAAIGTGVDDQIIITDEVLKGNREFNISKPIQKSRRSKRADKKKGKTDNKKVKVSRRITGFRLRIRSAFFIIYASAATLIAAMLPIAYVGYSTGSGLGVLVGFAFTTIVGVLIGIFITRPVYAKFVELLVGTN
ncbi:MAG: SecDF P1 head subdomain-containing protein [Methanobacterium sp.]|jgi:preprotein translocase subunit SecD